MITTEKTEKTFTLNLEDMQWINNKINFWEKIKAQIEAAGNKTAKTSRHINALKKLKETGKAKLQLPGFWGRCLEEQTFEEYKENCEKEDKYQKERENPCHWSHYN